MYIYIHIYIYICIGATSELSEQTDTDYICLHPEEIQTFDDSFAPSDASILIDFSEFPVIQPRVTSQNSTDNAVADTGVPNHSVKHVADEGTSGWGVGERGEGGGHCDRLDCDEDTVCDVQDTKVSGIGNGVPSQDELDVTLDDFCAGYEEALAKAEEGVATLTRRLQVAYLLGLGEKHSWSIYMHITTNTLKQTLTPTRTPTCIRVHSQTLARVLTCAHVRAHTLYTRKLRCMSGGRHTRRNREIAVSSKMSARGAESK